MVVDREIKIINAITYQKNFYMNDLMELLKILLPSLVILAVVYFMMREFTKHNSKQIDIIEKGNDLQKLKLEYELKSASQKTSIPLKFQAYERMILFLERITPSNLITRVAMPTMNIERLHSQLLATIREEYEHNMSQQLYISDNAWELVKSAKEDIIRKINSTASKFNSDDNSGEFAKEIIIEFGKSENPVEKALHSLKEDIRKHFA